MDTKAYWVGFNMVRGIGAVRLKALLEHFGSLEVAWQASADELRSVGLNEKIIENLFKVRNQVDLERIWDKIESQGIQVITWEDAIYPRRLKEIDQPPPTLYVRGELTLEDEWAIALVGTRRMTVYGRQVADELSRFLASNHVTVVSGLARGVDAVAHQAALQAGGRTIAVLGSGVDYIYPPEHRKMAEEICKQGALISEYVPGTQPESTNFPPRNRIISGLSMATVVIEAGETSGALITATFAAEQGREVFAVPGSILAPQSKGTNRLIREGARPMLNVEEVLEVLNLEQVQEYRQARLALPADEVETKLLEVLQDEPLHVDEIQYRSGLPVDKVSATLVMMELKGMVRQAGAMTYQAVREPSTLYRTNK
jgi:DNA processing protein